MLTHRAFSACTFFVARLQLPPDITVTKLFLLFSSNRSFSGCGGLGAKPFGYQPVPLSIHLAHYSIVYSQKTDTALCSLEPFVLYSVQPLILLSVASGFTLALAFAWVRQSPNKCI